MGKNKNKGAVPPAPKVEAPAVEEPEVINGQKKVEVIDANGLAEQLNNPTPGLDANHQVDLLNGLDRHFMQPNAATKLGISQETVDKVNAFTAHGWVIVAANEGMFGTSAFAGTIRQSMLPVILDAAKDMGINIDQKALPAPAADGTIQIPSSAIKPSKEAAAQLKKEHEALVAKPEIDPTKIESEEDLTKAINFIMADRANGYEKLKDSINFYRSYLSFKNKENADELAKIKAKTDLDLLGEIRDIIKDCPLVLSGMGRSMGTFTGSTKSPVSAFCMFKNSTKNRKTGEFALTDTEVADYARFIVLWANDINIAGYKHKIEEHEKNLKVLSADKKANANAIEDVNSKIEDCKKSIAHLEEIIDIVTNPDFNAVDALIENYDAKDRIANSIFKHVVTVYYPDVDMEKTGMDTLKHNVQQQAGIITNLFRDPATPNTEYSIANLIEVTRVEKEEEDEGKK